MKQLFRHVRCSAYIIELDRCNLKHTCFSKTVKCQLLIFLYIINFNRHIMLKCSGHVAISIYLIFLKKKILTGATFLFENQFLARQDKMSGDLMS